MRMYLKIIIIFLVTSSRLLACDCECVSDCSFHKVIENSKLVALVKVISYDNYLGGKIIGHNGKMPNSMIVEIIKVYKGTLTKQKIKIWGDNGALCRPYIADFALGDYFLIAPNKIEEPRSNDESKTDYEFFSCSADYLEVDMKTKVAFGQYTKRQDRITLVEFERKMKM
ncbi:MAG: hypothetical protein HYZ44_16855 [Bacteroidetes bacterium]|nr:hypothetical protein [Bacteroidota bacterium]